MNHPLEVLAQQAAETHLAACQEALFGWEDGDGDEAPESPASAPFCGCDTCVVREVLWAAWGYLVALAADEEPCGVTNQMREDG